MVRDICVTVSFLNHTILKKDPGVVQGDYNTTRFIFQFEEDVSNKRIVFEMSNPAGELILAKELGEDKSVILAGYTDEGEVYSLFNTSGPHPFELVLYGEDSRLTSATGWLTVNKKQVNIGNGETVEGYLPIFDELLNGVTTLVGPSAYEIAVANGFKGTEEEWLASLKGEPGEPGTPGSPGDKGEPGDQGEPGTNGVTPEFSIGTVVTLKAGQPADVTLTGTAEKPILNFGIPQGSTGGTGQTFPKTVSGEGSIILSRVSETPHTVKVKISGVDDPTESYVVVPSNNILDLTNISGGLSYDPEDGGLRTAGIFEYMELLGIIGEDYWMPPSEVSVLSVYRGHEAIQVRVKSKDLDVYLRVGESVILPKIDDPGVDRYRLEIYNTVENARYDGEKLYIMLNYGTIPCTYEPYGQSKWYVPKEDGTVDIPSKSPFMELRCPGALITATYRGFDDLEYIPTPPEAEVGQVLMVKEVDRTGKPTQWGAEFLSANEFVGEHNVDPTSHNDIRLLFEGLNNRLNALADSDDTTLDQMSEIVAYIKSNKDLIDSVTTSKVNVSDIVDNLTTAVSNKPLAANQGVELVKLMKNFDSILEQRIAQYYVPKDEILDLVYPIGSIYITMYIDNPENFLGGKWRKIEDRFLLAEGELGVGDTGGEETHALTVEEMPRHNHGIGTTQSDAGSPLYSNYAYGVKSISNTESGSKWYAAGTKYTGGTASLNNGESVPHNNMPPYLVVMMWERIG